MVGERGGESHGCMGDSIHSFLPAVCARSARMAGLSFYVFLRLFVCLFVCEFALITCAIFYVVHYYATVVYQVLEVCGPSYSKCK